MGFGMKFWKKGPQNISTSLGGKIDSELAFKNAILNKFSKWPSRGEKNRIEPFCEPNLEPQHIINSSDNIMTIGSCFARNIEYALRKQKFSVPSGEVKFPEEELWSGTLSHSGLLNKYTPYAILNELDYVFNDGYSAEDFLVEGENNKYHDMQLHTNQGTTFDRGVERRNQIKTMVREFVSTADVVVVTLGLVEVWWDNLNKVYLNEMPPKLLLEKHKGRFYFETMTPNQVFDSVSDITSILKKHTKKNSWIMLTVSPVPLARTFRNKGVILANMYSKSLLRVAAELESEKSKSVEYFPSYESIMLSSREGTWEDDQIHIEYPAIENITKRMIATYCKKN